MLFNGGLVPNFLLIRDIGLYNNIFAQILPGILSAFNVILMINFFKELPGELLEAARVDGASEPRVLFQIVVPLSKAVIATIACYTFKNPVKIFNIAVTHKFAYIFYFFIGVEYIFFCLFNP